MPIEFATCLNRDVLYARWFGLVTLQDALSNFVAYQSDPNYRPGRPELIDQSGLVEVQIEFAEVRAFLGQVNNQVEGQVVETQTEVWCPTDEAYGLSRMYEQLAAAAGGIRVRTHRNEADVLAALNLPYDTIAAFLAAEEFVPSLPAR